MTDLAETLEAGIARAREHRANVGRADELALRLAAHEAGVPMEHPIAEMFLAQYRGPVDADHVAAEWHRRVLNRAVPQAVAERIAERERDARLARYEKALQEEPENADE